MAASDVLAAIDAAILAIMSNGGAQTLEIGGRRVTYYSLDDLLKARAEFENLASTDSGQLPFGMYTTKPRGVNNV